MPSTVLDNGNIAVKETEKFSAFLGFIFQWGEKENKQMNISIKFKKSDRKKGPQRQKAG